MVELDGCETKLACQLWSLHNLIVYCWNAVSFLVKLEGNCWKSEVLCYRKKPLMRHLQIKQQLPLNSSHEMFCACAVSWAFSLKISRASKCLSLLACEQIPQIIFYFMDVFLFGSIEWFLHKVISNMFALFLFLHVCLHHITLPSSHTIVFRIQ